MSSQTTLLLRALRMRRRAYFAWGLLKIKCTDVTELHFYYTRLINILAQNPLQFQRAIVMVTETITILEYSDITKY